MADYVAQTGTVVDPRLGATSLLDFPGLETERECNLHFELARRRLDSNWHRHYFPLIDFEEKYSAVIAALPVAMTR